MSIDPDTGIRPIAEWGNHCARGFVSNPRFGAGLVIERTNRDVSRKWREKEKGPQDAGPRLKQKGEGAQ